MLLSEGIASSVSTVLIYEALAPRVITSHISGEYKNYISLFLLPVNKYSPGLLRF